MPHIFFLVSFERDLNPRPLHYEWSALPTELSKQKPSTNTSIHGRSTFVNSFLNQFSHRSPKRIFGKITLIKNPGHNEIYGTAGNDQKNGGYHTTHRGKFLPVCCKVNLILKDANGKSDTKADHINSCQSRPEEFIQKHITNPEKADDHAIHQCCA